MITKNFPFKYYFYGSEDSIDTDMLIEISSELMPITQEDRKEYLKVIEMEFDITYNTNLVVIENGIITDTIYPKAWIDSVNNSLFNTYKYHKQYYSNPIERLVERNKLLAIYKTVRTVLAVLSRTHYRTLVKPILNGCHDFNLKLDALSKIDFSTIDKFNQRNMKDVDIWKVLAFYIGQNISLVNDNIEIYSKKELVKYHPLLYNFIYRKELNDNDILNLNNYLKKELTMIKDYGTYISSNNMLSCGNDIINMKNEIY